MRNIELKINDQEVVNMPSGDFKDQVTGAEIKKRFKNFVHLYPSLFKNVDAIKHYLGIQVKSVSRMGKSYGIKKALGPGKREYNILMGRKQFDGKNSKK